MGQDPLDVLPILEELPRGLYDDGQTLRLEGQPAEGHVRLLHLRRLEPPSCYGITPHPEEMSFVSQERHGPGPSPNNGGLRAHQVNDLRGVVFRHSIPAGGVDPLLERSGLGVISCSGCQRPGQVAETEVPVWGGTTSLGIISQAIGGLEVTPFLGGHPAGGTVAASCRIAIPTRCRSECTVECSLGAFEPLLTLNVSHQLIDLAL